MQNDQRLLQLNNWLKERPQLEDFKLEVASADASFRRYFRIITPSKTFIAMDAPPDKEDSSPFIKIAELIEQTGVQSPHIFEVDLQQGFMLLSDLGSIAYLDQLNTQNITVLYQDAIHALIKMQSIQADIPEYDTDKLQAEMNLFNEWFLCKHLNIKLSKTQLNTLNNIFSVLLKNANEQLQVFVHRDFHSRNLMATKLNNPGVIDFQDAVIGPITYDLVSLLKDCYICWPRKKQLKLIKYFYKNCGAEQHCDIKAFIRHYDLMGLQRHIKIAGIFCRLNYRDGKQTYLNDLPLTLAYIFDVCKYYDELKPLDNLLNSLNIHTDNKLLEKLL